jgi:hypothetical protein
LADSDIGHSVANRLDPERTRSGYRVQGFLVTTETALYQRRGTRAFGFVTEYYFAFLRELVYLYFAGSDFDDA